MACRRMVLCVLILVLGNYALAISMDELCEKHQAAGRCDRERIAKQCPKQCGGGDNSNNNGGGGGGGGDGGNKPPPKSGENMNQKPSSSSSKKNCDKRSPCVSMEEANKAFRARCEATNGELKSTCYDHCRYDQDTNQMKKAFLGGPCPLSQLRVFLTAASNKKDNSACCVDQGVLAQKKTSVCGCFCNPTGDVWPQKGEAAKYAPCVGVLQGIVNCHYYAEGAD